MANNDTPRHWGVLLGTPVIEPSFLPGMTQAMHRITYYVRPWKFDPATPLTSLALRLFAVSNGFHECRSDRID